MSAFSKEVTLDEFNDTVDILLCCDGKKKHFVEQKHGEWISLEKTRCKGQLLPFWRTHECSVCSSTGQGDFNFCPKCGADMRGKNDE